MACAAPEHKFTVIAPAKYNESIKIMEIDDFSTSSRHGRNFSSSLTNLVKGKIANEGYITVVKSGGQATLSGDINLGKIKTHTYTKKYKGEKKTYYTYYYNKKATVTGSYSLLGANNRKTITGDTFEFTFDKTWSSSDGRSQAQAKSDENEKIYNVLLELVAQQIVCDISPHKTIVSRKMQTCGDQDLKLGITYLTNGRSNQAIAIWDQVIKAGKNPEVTAAAYYNIGVVKESQGDLESAFHVFSKANELDIREELYIKAMTRAESAKLMRDKATRQIN